MQHNYCQHIHRKDTAKEHDIPWLSILHSSLSSALGSFIVLPGGMCFMSQSNVGIHCKWPELTLHKKRLHTMKHTVPYISMHYSGLAINTVCTFVLCHITQNCHLIKSLEGMCGSLKAEVTFDTSEMYSVRAKTTDVVILSQVHCWNSIKDTFG